ncbi:MAG: TenA family protein [Nitrososphaerota archaeon]
MPVFTAQLWRGNADVYAAILEHPFLTGLTDGTLKMETFREYIVQDALYLGRFARAVSLVGAKAPDDDSALTLISASKDALSVERASLHDFLLAEWGISPADISNYSMSPINRAYTDFLIATAYEKPFLTGLSAILPCFWVYLEVGKELVKRGSTVETYRRWIETYSSPGYEEAVRKIIALAEKASETASVAELDDSRLVFRLSAIYEYLFWDSISRGERWPLPLRS